MAVDIKELRSRYRQDGVTDRFMHHAYYGLNRARFPSFKACFADVPDEDKEFAVIIALAVVDAMLDDVPREHLNLNVWEALCQNEEALEAMAKAAHEADARLRSACMPWWPGLKDFHKAFYMEVAREVSYGLVDDGTTPGCDCDYCTWDPESGKARRVMCRQRWNALPSAQRIDIAESIEG